MPDPSIAGLRRNPARLCVFHALQMALFPVAIITLFWKHSIGLDMAEILLLQGLFGLSMAVFEFPSGYVADRIGYRRTLIAASIVSTIGWILYASADTFATILLTEVLLGLGMSLISGCDSALLYESLREVDHEETFTRWTGRVRFFSQGAEGTAALFAGLLYVWSPRLPFWLEVGVWTANVAVAWSLTEPRRHLPASGGHVENVRLIVHTALVSNRKLAAIIVLSIAMGLSSFLPVWLVPLYAEDAGVPVVWLGLIWAVANYTVALGSLASDGGRRHLGLGPLLGVGVVLIAIGYVGLGVSHALFGFAFYFSLTAMRGLVGPALAHQEQRLIPSGDRAGFVSLRSLLFRLAFLALGPVAGVAIDRYGQHEVLLVIGPILVVCTSLALWWARRVGALASLPSPAAPAAGA